MLNTPKKLFIPLINRLGFIRAQSRFTSPPVLIGGCGRSGTTLLLAMLSAHPAIFTFPHELSVFNHWTTRRDGSKVPLRSDRMYRYLLTHKIPAGIHRWCEKTPYNVRYIENILNYFNEQVRFIHIIRDGRDVCLSKHPDKPGTYWISPDRWINDVQAGLRYQDHEYVHTIYYEDLILHYRETMKGIIHFLGETYGAEMENWIDNTQVKQNNAWYGSVEILHTHSVKKWKNTEDRQRIKELTAHPGFKDLLEKLNYM